MVGTETIQDGTQFYQISQASYDTNSADSWTTHFTRNY